MKLFNKFKKTKNPVHQRKKVAIKNYKRHGASTLKKIFQGWITKNESVRGDIDENVDKLRERSKDLYMSGSFGTGIPKTLRTKIVGPGLIPKPNIDHDVIGITREQKEIIERQRPGREKKGRREAVIELRGECCELSKTHEVRFVSTRVLVYLVSWTNGDGFKVTPRHTNTMPFIRCCFSSI